MLARRFGTERLIRWDVARGIRRKLLAIQPVKRFDQIRHILVNLLLLEVISFFYFSLQVKMLFAIANYQLSVNQVSMRRNIALSSKIFLFKTVGFT